MEKNTSLEQCRKEYEHNVQAHHNVYESRVQELCPTVCCVTVTSSCGFSTKNFFSTKEKADAFIEFMSGPSQEQQEGLGVSCHRSWINIKELDTTQVLKIDCMQQHDMDY